MKKTYLISAVVSLFLSVNANNVPMIKNMVNVKDFGAVGDGLFKDTRAIQRAVDTGKIVYFPPGVYRTGTIYLKSGGGLHLADHAVILASPHPEDYNKDDFDKRNPIPVNEYASGAHLIIARDASDITISGSGSIHGNRNKIFDTDLIHMPRGRRPRYLMPRWRPGAMLYFIGCKNIKVEGVKLTDPTYWTAFFHDCENLVINRVIIMSDFFTNNSDGLDIDCCRNVKITNCTIFSGDDSIAIRGSERKLNKVAECANVIVDNCTLASAACGVRVGVGTGTIRNCKLSNLKIVDAGIGIGICPSYRFGNATRIDNIEFSNIKIDAVQALRMVPNWNTVNDDPAIKKVTNLSFNNIEARSSKASIIAYPSQEGIFDNITIKDSTFTLSEGSVGPMVKYWTTPEYGIINIRGKSKPHIINCRGNSPDNKPLILQKSH